MNEPNPDTRIPELMSALQAAESLGIKRQAVIKAAQKGTLPARRVGTIWAFLRSGIEQLALERAEKSKNEIGRADFDSKTTGHSVL